MYGGPPYVQVGTKHVMWSFLTLQVGPDETDPRPNPDPYPDPTPSGGRLEVGTRSAGAVLPYIHR